jgi:hypothetical protein
VAKLKLKNCLLKRTMMLSMKEMFRELRAVAVAVAIATTAKMVETMQVLIAEPIPQRLTS